MVAPEGEEPLNAGTLGPSSISLCLADRLHGLRKSKAKAEEAFASDLEEFLCLRT